MNSIPFSGFLWFNKKVCKPAKLQLGQQKLAAYFNGVDLPINLNKIYCKYLHIHFYVRIINRNRFCVQFELPRDDEHFSSKSNDTKRIPYHIYQGDTRDERTHQHFLDGHKC